MNDRLGDLGDSVPSWAVETQETSPNDIDVEMGEKRPVSARVTDTSQPSSAFSQPKFM